MKEFRIEPETLQNGSVWDLVLSEDKAQRYIFVADGANNQMLCSSATPAKCCRASVAPAAWRAS